MIIVLAFFALQPIVPGSVSIKHIPDVPVRFGRIVDTAQLSIISDDGNVVFANQGKFVRYSFDRFVNQGGEDLFNYLVGNKARSLTTSQAAHVDMPEGSTLVFHRVRKIFAAPTKSQFLLGSSMGGFLRLTVVNVDARGHYPNQDFDIAEKVSNTEPQLLHASSRGKSTVWHVLFPKYDKGVGAIESVTLSDGRIQRRNIGFVSGHSFDDYDPKTGLMVGTAGYETYGGVAVIARRSNYSSIKTPLPPGPDSQKTVFLSRTKVFAQTDRLYVRDSDHKWKPFGSEFVVLAKSANGKYWLILDQNEQAWKVTF